MKREFRLRKSKDFKRVRRLGKSYAHPLMVLITHPNQLEISRIGIAAGRSIGNAVKRNRTKRLLRSAAAKFHRDLSPGWDLLLLARRPLSEVDANQASQGLEVLLRRAKLFSNPNLEEHTDPQDRN